MCDHPYYLILLGDMSIVLKNRLGAYRGSSAVQLFGNPEQLSL